MTELSLQEMQRKEFELLAAFYDYCKANMLCCYLIGGTLLGAVRHQGFIPWDDDVDVCMPRPDYERLLDMTVRKGLQPEGLPAHFFLQSPDNGFVKPYSRLFDQSVKVIRPYTNDNNGVNLFLDILVVDGLPSDDVKLLQLYRKRAVYDRLVRIREARPLRGKSAIRALGKTLLMPLTKLRSAKWYIGRIEDLAKSNPYDSSDCVGVLTAAAYDPMGERMPKKEFEVPTSVWFEGKQFETFSCWDEYLSGVYGDYMTPKQDAASYHIHSAQISADDQCVIE